MYAKSWQVSSRICKYFVILVTLFYVIRFTDSAVTNRIESYDEELFSESPLVSTTPASLLTPCTLTNSSFNCSSLELSAIPKKIPHSITQLNLSHNNLQTLDDDAFDECCENLTVLDLSNNSISSLTRRHFERLKNLEILLLSSNKISSLAPDSFITLTKFKRLDLRNNPLELQDSNSEGFLISTSLEELNLDNCNINELPEKMFNNLTQLRSLTLSGNSFDNIMDVSAFEPLKNLIKLRMNTLSETTIYMLCEKLIAIDIINLDEYNISCTVLSDDVPFEESIINNDSALEPEMRSVILQPVTTTRKVAVTESTTISTTQLSTRKPTQEEMSTILPQPQMIETSNETSTNATILEHEAAKIDIDIKTIKFILLGIFVVTIFGILTGLVCRADICGIKTKLCRTKKTTDNRRTPTDTVSPFEEIPLNSVNGKTVEGQG